jgi:hypothetical protein
MAARMIDPAALRQYLSLGFVPDPELASDYLDGLFTAPREVDSKPTRLLTEILAELTAGASDVAIPLSAGKDSRALLGAALQSFSPQRIHCFTFGPERSEDVLGARLASGRTGVAHEVIDPDRAQWDLEELTAAMAQRIKANLGLPPIDGLAIFGSLAAAIPGDMPVLSGFLGIAANGKHLGGGALDNDPDAVLARFLRQNRAVLSDQPEAMFRSFLAAHETLRREWPGLTSFDLVDFGFRQRFRIRASVTGAFKKPVRPYEHPRWIGHWFGQPVAARIGQERYNAELAAAFPRVFGAAPLGWKIRRWLGSKGAGGAEDWIADRGDVRRNASMAAALEEACRSFDARGFGIGESARDAFETLFRAPSKSAFRTVRWFATAEILARAQERALQPPAVVGDGGLPT